MARTVGELPISDQYAVVPASTRLNEAIDLMSKPTVEILLVEDPEVKRIVGVLTEQHILRILASGADASRTKVATHMLPNKKSVRGILRLTPDAPVADAKQFILDQNPVAVIIERQGTQGEVRQEKGGRRGSAQQLLGFLSPADLEAVQIEHVDPQPHRRLADEALAAHPALQPEVRTPDVMRRFLEETSSEAVAHLSNEVAEQLIAVSTHYLAEHGPMNQPGSQRPNGREWMTCSSSSSGGLTAVWPISDGDLAVHGTSAPLYICAWMSSPSTTPPEAWHAGVLEHMGKRPGGGYSAMLVDIVSDRTPRLDGVVRIGAAAGRGRKGRRGVALDFSAMNEFDAERHRLLICAHA
ncbi:MAG: CBS domain-containing protein [Candidatus Thermoplasmatota archaeon]|nr:CBS domain-containing protein [Candidatus Thermoplasmatota archaeon]